jgi:pathogenesis-related protein 1
MDIIEGSQASKKLAPSLGRLHTRSMTFASQPKYRAAAWAGTAALWLAAAAALHGQMAPEPADTLARARLKITATMRRLPKYICVQTIDRSYFGRVAATTAPNSSCSQAGADGQKGRASPRLDTTDRVRIDVAEVDGSEIHLWTGASGFETGDIEELFHRGPTGTGSFGGYLVDIFDNDGTQFSFVSERTEGSRRIFGYTYSVAQESSGYKVRAEDHWVTTAYRGAFDIDAASLELLRITVDPVDLPKEMGLCEAQSALEYASVRIGDGDFLLPSQSQLHTVNPGRMETNSSSVFTSCREYRAESVLSFGGDADTPGASASHARSRDPLGAGIRLTLRLDAGIDSDTAAAGDPVTARVMKPVRDPKSNAIVFRVGAVAHGRINRMEHWLNSVPRFVVGIHWDSMSAGEDAVPFNAIRDRSGEAATAAMHTLPLRPMPVGPPDALVFPAVAKRYAIRAGYESQWTTVTPPAQKNSGATASGDAFAREMLAAHNAIRASVQVPALAWSEKLAAVAQAWANTLSERHRFEHQPNSPYGENLFEIAGREATPAEVTDTWAAEADDYDYKANSCHGVCGHYTQLVWRTTREVGCAAAQGGGREIVACEYDPPGNRQGQRPW